MFGLLLPCQAMLNIATISAIGGYIAYINGFLLYAFLALRLLMIFEESITKCQNGNLHLFHNLNID